MPNKRVLDVGNCDPDHGAIRRLLLRHFDVSIDRVMFVEEARLALSSEKYDLVLVNRLIFADQSDGLNLVKAMQASELRTTPVMMISNHADAQRRAVAAGAVPGFGKRGLEDPETIERLGAYLPRKQVAA